MGTKRFRIIQASILALSVLTVAWLFEDGQAQQSPTGPATNLTYADQGWSAEDRDIFYTTSQGSRLMPFVWFKALKRLDVDEPFAADQLQRYGYLPNDVSASNPGGLPVGFVIDGDQTSGEVGLNCAACHTAQLEYTREGMTHVLRLDGAPSNVDAQQFLTELLTASQATLTQSDRFEEFAEAVLGSQHTARKAKEIKEDLREWVLQFQKFVEESLPATPQWGPARLDAFGLIFNQVVAGDLGIPGNFAPADAPVSYPFLWNASKQDRTQWNGAVPNGLYIRAFARNSGEVFGAFADFRPEKKHRLRGVDYSDSSADLTGLLTLEEKIIALKAPRWPEIFGLDVSLAAHGETLFGEHCSRCHAERPSVRLPLPGRWDTPVEPVGTDPKMVLNAARTIDPGILKGELLLPPKIGTISDPARAADVLATAVAGSLRDAAIHIGLSRWTLRQKRAILLGLRRDFAELFRDRSWNGDASDQTKQFIADQLGALFDPPSATGSPAYESRVLYGIWATAPYLHNGSVPNLWELLKPAAERTTSFMVGSRVFDPKNVGYDTEHSPFKNGLFVVDPANANGNGNAGHEYGTTLTEEERWAIVEYLKTL